MVLTALLKGDALGRGCERPPMTAEFLASQMDLYSHRDFSLLADIRPVDLAMLSSEPEKFPMIGSTLKRLTRDLQTDRSKFDKLLFLPTVHDANVHTAVIVDHAIRSAFHGKQTESVASETSIHPELMRLFFESLYPSQLAMIGSFQLLYIFVHFGVGPFNLQDNPSYFFAPREMRIIAKAFSSPFAHMQYFGLGSGFELSTLLWSNLKTEEAKQQLLKVLGAIAYESALTTMAEVKLILSGRQNSFEPLASAPLCLMQAFYSPDPFMAYNAGTPVEAVVESGFLTITSRPSIISDSESVSGPVLFHKSVEQVTLDDIAELERQGFRCERYAHVMKPIIDKLTRASEH